MVHQATIRTFNHRWPDINKLAHNNNNNNTSEQTFCLPPKPTNSRVFAFFFSLSLSRSQSLFTVSKLAHTNEVVALAGCLCVCAVDDLQSESGRKTGLLLSLNSQLFVLLSFHGFGQQSVRFLCFSISPKAKQRAASSSSGQASVLEAKSLGG